MLLDKSGVLKAYVTWQISDTEGICYLTNQGYWRPLLLDKSVILEAYVTLQIRDTEGLCYLTNQGYWRPMLLDKLEILKTYVTWQIGDTEGLCSLTNEGYLRPITWQIRGTALVSCKHYRPSDSFNYTFAINDLRQTKALKANKSYFVEAN